MNKFFLSLIALSFSKIINSSEIPNKKDTNQWKQYQFREDLNSKLVGLTKQEEECTSLYMKDEITTDEYGTRMHKIETERFSIQLQIAPEQTMGNLYRHENYLVRIRNKAVETAVAENRGNEQAISNALKASSKKEGELSDAIRKAKEKIIEDFLK